MARYIDADRLLKEIEDSPDKPKINDGAEEAEWIMKCINSAPAADVRPERRGHWIFQEPDATLHPWQCSCCGKSSGMTRYCHNCGAKMVGYDG